MEGLLNSILSAPNQANHSAPGLETKTTQKLGGLSCLYLLGGKVADKLAELATRAKNQVLSKLETIWGETMLVIN